MQDPPRIAKSITVENPFFLIAQMQREIAQDAASEPGPASGEEACLNAAERGAVLLLEIVLAAICSIYISGSQFCLSCASLFVFDFDAHCLSVG